VGSLEVLQATSGLDVLSDDAIYLGRNLLRAALDSFDAALVG